MLVAVDGSESSDLAVEEVIGMDENCSNLKEVYAVPVASSEDGLTHAQELVEAVCKKGLARAPHVGFHPLTLVGKHAPDMATWT